LNRNDNAKQQACIDKTIQTIDGGAATKARTITVKQVVESTRKPPEGSL